MALRHSINFLTNHPLASKRRLAAFSRFAKWQIGGRLMPGDVVYNWIDGAKFLVRPGEAGLTGNIYCGLHEFEDMGFLLHVVESSDLFVDIGANVGSFTVLACAARGAKGVCFEPVPSTFDRLQKNLRINDLGDRVEAINAGLGNTPEGQLLFTAGLDTCNHVVSEEDATSDTIRVDVTTLDVALDGRVPAVMKIDVEGFETPVLEGAINTLQNEQLHSIIMELNGAGERYGYSEDEILKTVLDLGFATYAYDPLKRELSPLDGRQSEGGNTIFIRNIDLVREKIANAPKVDLLGAKF